MKTDAQFSFGFFLKNKLLSQPGYGNGSMPAYFLNSEFYGQVVPMKILNLSCAENDNVTH